jgi:NDP-sugar pyrophosphorylase family protein
MSDSHDVLILSGGFGTRLRGTIGEAIPKPMASIAGRPFLELLLRQLRRHGFARVILGVGYRYEVIREHFGERSGGVDLIYSVESSPLGTAGALRQALDFVKSESLIVMNGDSYTNVDLRALPRAHAERNADVTAVVIPDKRSDAGSVQLGPHGSITSFAEKLAVEGSRYISAGIYVFRRELLAGIPVGQKLSLEEQVFPQWLADGRQIAGFIYEGDCLDIGTPERFQKAQHALEAVELGGAFELERKL